MLAKHLFESSDTGALYDTRRRNWHSAAPLRAVYRRTYQHIKTVAQFKATLRAGAYAWPGGYPLYLLCDDGAALCFSCGRNEVRHIMPAIAGRDKSGWRVVACDINYEDSELDCAHCGNNIEPAYGKESEHASI